MRMILFRRDAGVYTERLREVSVLIEIASELHGPHCEKEVFMIMGVELEAT